MSPQTKRRSRNKGSNQTPLPLGPWKGVRDLGDAGMQSPEYLQDAINCHFQDPQNGGSVWARPGSRRVTGTALGEAVTLIHGIEEAGGTVRLFLATTGGSGKVYRQLNLTTWTDVTPVGVTFGTTYHPRAETFGDEVIFAGGFSLASRKPWRATNLGSTPITKTDIEVDSTPSGWSARNAPTVYGGKLFFIVELIGATYYNSRIVWSEELSAGTGYMQSGYANYWDVIPTSTERINAIVGTNEALYYFRRDSIGAIKGAVNSTFATTSTGDAVSQKIGCDRYTQPLVANGYIWFLDVDGLPWRFRIGSTTMEPLWEQLRQRITKIRSTTYNALAAYPTYLITNPSIAYLHDLHKVAILFLRDSAPASASDAAALTSRNVYLFDADTGNYEGRWMLELASQPSSETPTACKIRVITSTLEGLTSQRKRFMAGGLRSDSATDGNVFWQYLQQEQTLGDNSAAMHQSVTGMLTPDEQNVELHVDEIAVETVPDTATTLNLDYYTPRGSKTGLALGATDSSTDVIASSYDRGIRRAGLDPGRSFGRWWRHVLHWNVPSGTTQYVIEKASVKVRVQAATATSP